MAQGEQLVYDTPAGDWVNLSRQDLEWYPLALMGRDMPPVILHNDPVPSGHGEVLRGVRLGPRDLALVGTLVGESVTQIRARRRALVTGFRPTAGLGTFRVSTPDGVERFIPAVFTDGLPGDDWDRGGVRFQRLALKFYCPHPHWRSNAERVYFYSAGNTSSFFPILPVRLGDSQVFAEKDIHVDGDEATWPVWTVNGPGEDLKVENLTTGKWFTISTTLIAGQYVTVDTTELRKTVRNHAGANLYPVLSGELFPLEPGDNTIRVTLGDTANPGSSVEMSYEPRWLSV